MKIVNSFSYTKRKNKIYIYIYIYKRKEKKKKVYVSHSRRYRSYLCPCVDVSMKKSLMQTTCRFELMLKEYRTTKILWSRHSSAKAIMYPQLITRPLTLSILRPTPTMDAELIIHELCTSAATRTASQAAVCISLNLCTYLGLPMLLH